MVGFSQNFFVKSKIKNPVINIENNRPRNWLLIIRAEVAPIIAPIIEKIIDDGFIVFSNDLSLKKVFSAPIEPKRPQILFSALASIGDSPDMISPDIINTPPLAPIPLRNPATNAKSGKITKIMLCLS